MKFIPYGQQFVDEGDIFEVDKVLRTNWFTQGPKIREFEQALCDYTGANYAVAVSNGTAALHLAALAAGIKKGDEVITSPITFVASSNCVLYCGGTPVFADICKDTVNIDPEKIKKKINQKTKAIIPVHFAGHPADLKEIKDIANEKGLTIIEDAAHALGAVYNGSKIGACEYSDMSIFSFHPVKHITTGEGGAVLTNSKEQYEKLLLYRNHGITKDETKLKSNEGPWYYEMHELGYNYRITDFQCALGISQLKKLDGFIKRRRELADIYNKELSGIDEIILPIEKSYASSSWHLYYIRLKDQSKRKKVFEKLQKENIGVQVHYIPVHLQPYYMENLKYKAGDFPIAENYYQSTITLPLYPKMTDDDINYVIDVIKRII